MALLASCGDPAGGADPRPDVVLIVIDTLRADHLGLYGYPEETAPFLSELGRRSAVFERAFSTSSWTAPATASVMTGLYPTRHGLTRGFFAQRDDEEAVAEQGQTSLDLTPLPEGVETLAERLGREGYRTRGFATNRNVCPQLGFSRGFDDFALQRFDAEQVMEALEGWRSELEEGGPHFLYLHFNDVHMPYNPRPPWYSQAEGEVEEKIARYDSEISFLDATLERLYREFGWDRDTLLWIVSDHGEEFQDHGHYGHVFSLHQELVHVLMLAHGPDLGILPGRIELNSSLVDVYPTVLDLVGLPVETEGDGVSLKGLLRGDSAAEEDLRQRVLFAHRRKATAPEDMWAAILGSWKLIERDDTGQRMLFDFGADPGEKRSVIEDNEVMVQTLEEQLARFREAAGSAPSARVEIPLDREALEDLKALGYFGED